MTGLAIFGLSVTFAVILDRCIKPRAWRMWLGIVMAGFGIFATFMLPQRLDETDIGMVYLAAWFGGLFMFFDRGRYKDED